MGLHESVKPFCANKGDNGPTESHFWEDDLPDAFMGKHYRVLHEKNNVEVITNVENINRKNDPRNNDKTWMKSLPLTWLKNCVFEFEIDVYWGRKDE